MPHTTHLLSHKSCYNYMRHPAAEHLHSPRGFCRCVSFVEGIPNHVCAPVFNIWPARFVCLALSPLQLAHLHSTPNILKAWDAWGSSIQFGVCGCAVTTMKSGSRGAHLTWHCESSSFTTALCCQVFFKQRPKWRIGLADLSPTWSPLNHCFYYKHPQEQQFASFFFMPWRWFPLVPLRVELGQKNWAEAFSCR